MQAIHCKQSQFTDQFPISFSLELNKDVRYYYQHFSAVLMLPSNKVDQ